MSFENQDPKGRVDILLHGIGRKLAQHVAGEKGERVWDNGLGEVTGRILENAGLSKPITAVGVAEDLGLIKRRKAIK